MEVVKLPLVEALSVKEVFKEARKEKFQDVIIMGYTADDHVTYIASKISSRDALWLIEKTKKLMFEDRI